MSEAVKTNVYNKLARARVMLQSSGIKKTGWNKFSNYSYFQLDDFLPRINEIFSQIGLFSAFSIEGETARLNIYDSDTTEFITFKSPIAESGIKGASPIQNLGGVHTYMRRYLWLMAMEIVESDAVDGLSEEQKDKPGNKPKSGESPKNDAQIIYFK